MGDELESDREARMAVLMSSISDSRATLFPNEEFWRGRQKFLEARGYILRTRYHPDWVPSWRTMDIDPHRCDDFYPLFVSPIFALHARTILRLTLL